MLDLEDISRKVLLNMIQEYGIENYKLCLYETTGDTEKSIEQVKYLQKLYNTIVYQLSCICDNIIERV